MFHLVGKALPLPPPPKFTRANNKEVRNAPFAETLFQVIQF